MIKQMDDTLPWVVSISVELVQKWKQILPWNEILTAIKCQLYRILYSNSVTLVQKCSPSFFFDVFNILVLGIKLDLFMKVKMTNKTPLKWR